MKFWLKLPLYLLTMLAGVFVLSIYLIVSETVKLAHRMGKESKQ